MIIYVSIRFLGSRIVHVDLVPHVAIRSDWCPHQKLRWLLLATPSFEAFHVGGQKLTNLAMNGRRKTKSITFQNYQLFECETRIPGFWSSHISKGHITQVIMLVPHHLSTPPVWFMFFGWVLSVSPVQHQSNPSNTKYILWHTSSWFDAIFNRFNRKYFMLERTDNMITYDDLEITQRISTIWFFFLFGFASQLLPNRQEGALQWPVGDLQLEAMPCPHQKMGINEWYKPWYKPSKMGWFRIVDQQKNIQNWVVYECSTLLPH